MLTQKTTTDEKFYSRRASPSNHSILFLFIKFDSCAPPPPPSTIHPAALVHITIAHILCDAISLVPTTTTGLCRLFRYCVCYSVSQRAFFIVWVRCECESARSVLLLLLCVCFVYVFWTMCIVSERANEMWCERKMLYFIITQSTYYNFFFLKKNAHTKFGRGSFIPSKRISSAHTHNLINIHARIYYTSMLL